MTERKSTRSSFSYPQKMKDQLMILAERDRRSLSSYIQIILEEHLEKNFIDIPEDEQKDKNEQKKTKKRIKRVLKK